MSSPFVQSVEVAEKKVELFVKHEWETILAGSLVVLTLLYLAYSSPSENFGVYRSRSSTQAHFAQNDIPRVDGFQAAARDPEHIRTTVQRGAHIPSQGVSTEKFTEFARVDAIDDHSETSSHQPETSDEELAAVVY